MSCITEVNEQLKARVIAFYLPQFHPVECNDLYWGKGFTEWRNVAMARSLFPGHYQPRYPADLGYYDLRVPEIRDEQADLANAAGVEGFCYWHYWFREGREVLERPFDEVVRLKKPDLPFCLGWANHSWRTNTWTKVNNKPSAQKMIFEQEYLGSADNEAHFYRLLDAFKDERYIRVENKLLFVIYDLPGFKGFEQLKTQWNALAQQNNLPGFYFVSHTTTVGHISNPTLSGLERMVENSIKTAFDLGADGVETVNMRYAEFLAYGRLHKISATIGRKLLGGLFIEKYDFDHIIRHIIIEANQRANVFPEIVDGNDRSPRAGRNAIIYHDVTPDIFYREAKEAVECVAHKDFDHRLVFLNSWNEWGEGMYMEPDMRYGKGFIEALRSALT